VSEASGRTASGPARDNLVGALLIGAAIVIGLVLLVRGYDQEGALVTTDASTETTATTAAPPTTVEPVARPPAEVPVIVANGAGVAGAAGNLKTTLESSGYTTVGTSDASPVTTTLVYYAEGWQPEAKALATLIGTDPAAVRVLPTEPPVEMGDATVLVVLGPDKATAG
jgi:hypothetical protein